MNIYLFGDSVIDNSPYVGDENCVYKVLEKELLEDFPAAQVTNYANDGYTTRDVLAQLKDLEVDKGSYIFLSIGGNDLLNFSNTLLVQDSTDSLENLSDDIVSDIEGIKQRILKKTRDIDPREKVYGCTFLYYELIRQRLLKVAPKVIFLNLYSPAFDEYGSLFSEMAPVATSIFNSILDREYSSDSIIRLSDLAMEKEDFTNVIEPSVSGTKKIVKSIRLKIKELEKERKNYIRSSKHATYANLDIIEKSGRRATSFSQNMHPNPKFYKYYWHVFSRRSKFERKEFFDKCQLSTYEANNEFKLLRKTGEPYIIFNHSLPRKGPDAPFNENKSKYWAPSYDDDTDTPNGKDGHK